MIRLLAAYRRSAYRIGTVMVRIGRRSTDVDAMLRQAGVREATIIGAWNPRSRRMPEGWNRRAHRRLADCLRRFRCLQAFGGADQWWEAHLLVLGDPRPALVLARRFRQRAVVVPRRGQAARLVLLDGGWAAGPTRLGAPPRTAAGTATA